MKLSIRWKLLITIALPIVIIYLLVLWIDFTHLKKNIYEQVELYLEEVVERYAERFNTEFATAAQIARSTAQYLSQDDNVTVNELYETVVNNVRQSRFIYGSCVAFEPPSGVAGKKLFAPYAWRSKEQKGEIRKMDIAAEAYDYRTWDWYARPAKTRQAVWTEPYFDKGAGNIMMTTYSVPFYRQHEGIDLIDLKIPLLDKLDPKTEKFWGITTVDIDLGKLQEEHRGKLQLISHFEILDRDGTFVSHPRADYILKKSIFSLAKEEKRPELESLGKAFLKGERGIIRLRDYPQAGLNFIAYAPITSTGWIFSASVPEAAVMAPAWREIRNFSVFMLASLFVIVFVIFVISFGVTRPIRKLSSEMRKVGAGELEVKPSGRYANDELGSLAENFYKMIDNLKDHMRRLETETKVRESVESELRIAREIQTSLIPRTFPAFPERKELDLYALNLPAKYVAGDFYDYFFISEDELVLVIADVSGKGVSAALFMAVIRTLIRNDATASRSPAEALTNVNMTVAVEKAHGLFVTVFLVYYNVKTGRFRYACAGHPSPYLITSKGSVEQVPVKRGTVLGITTKTIYEDNEIRLKPGEMIVLFTDGVTEAREPGGEFWGEKNFKDALSGSRSLNCHDLCRNLAKQLGEFQIDHISDDITLLALHRTR